MKASLIEFFLWKAVEQRACCSTVFNLLILSFLSYTFWFTNNFHKVLTLNLFIPCTNIFFDVYWNKNSIEHLTSINFYHFFKLSFPSSCLFPILFFHSYQQNTNEKESSNSSEHLLLIFLGNFPNINSIKKIKEKKT